MVYLYHIHKPPLPLQLPPTPLPPRLDTLAYLFPGKPVSSFKTDVL